MWQSQDHKHKMFQHLISLWPQCKQKAQQQQWQQDLPAPPTHAPAAQLPGQQIVHINWSHFKPEFSGKPDENAEAHLLHTNDWMTAHHFVEGVKVQKF